MIRPAPGPPRAALYLRVSSAPQATSEAREAEAQANGRISAKEAERRREQDGTSLTTQEARGRAYVQEHGYQLVEVFTDIHTGAELAARKALSRLRELVRAGQLEVIVAYALDRLSRNQAHIYILDDEAEQHGARLEFVTEVFEDSAVGRLVRSGRAFAAEVEREKFAERSVRGRRARVTAGKRLPGAKPRYGYCYNADHTKLEIDEPTAAVVRRMFAESASGISVRQIARHLTIDQVPTPSGHSTFWRAAVIGNMLRDEQYVGRAAGFRTTRIRVRGKSGRVYYKEIPLPLEEHIPLPDGAVPAIVDEVTFAAAQQTVASGKALAPKRSRFPEMALLRGGFIRCGHCGHAMQVNTYLKAPRYQCVNNGNHPGACPPQPQIAIRKIDTIVWQKVCSIITEPEQLEDKRALLTTNPPTVAQLRRLTSQLAELGRQQRTLIANMAVVGPDIAPLLGERLVELGRQQQAVEAERQALERERDAHHFARQRHTALAVWCARMAAKLDQQPFSWRQQLLLTLQVKVLVWRQKDGGPDGQQAQITGILPVYDTADNSTDSQTGIPLRWMV